MTSQSWEETIEKINESCAATSTLSAVLKVI